MKMIDRKGLPACILALFVALSCSSGDEVKRGYLDNEGRSCTVDLNALHEAASCNVQAEPLNGCSASSPCYVVYERPDHQLQNCQTCCVGRTPNYPNSFDCALISCRSNNDCPHARPVCKDSFCYGGAVVGAAGMSGAAGAGNGGTGGTGAGAGGAMPSAGVAGAAFAGSSGAPVAGAAGTSSSGAGGVGAGGAGFPGAGAGGGFGSSGAGQVGTGGAAGSFGAGVSGTAGMAGRFGAFAGRAGF